MALASLASQRSNCMKRRVGCVLVGRERRVISTGYNGTPRGLQNCADGGCPRCNDGSGSGVGLATCLCIHAEENALLESGRERIRDGSVLYCDTCPCLTCSIKICQVGISEVVYAHGYSMDGETAAVFSQAGVKLRQFIPVSVSSLQPRVFSMLTLVSASRPMASFIWKDWIHTNSVAFILREDDNEVRFQHMGCCSMSFWLRAKSRLLVGGPASGWGIIAP
jgi:deoxycytidylate deaminase